MITTDKAGIQKRLEEIPKLIKATDDAIKKAKADLKVAEQNKAKLEKEFKRLAKTAKKF